MTTPTRIDFVADISCPFCAIAVTTFSRALAKVGDNAAFELHFQPYELNPQMPGEGQDFFGYLSAKSGATREQVQQRIAGLSHRAAEAGLTISIGEDSRIFNTFDAHRLLHWAGLDGKQHLLEQELYAAYFTDGRDTSSADILIETASSVDFDPEKARHLLTSQMYAEDVRSAEEHWKSRGVTSVPAIFIDGELAFSGAQSEVLFEKELRNIALAKSPFHNSC
ncbi:MAG: disulfide bond formation protein DsbA [Stutzerimonas stutzeri]|nr:MAG: disulfide bond formation protein DsbA [Stutzerimonas stutzeri]